VWWMMDEDGFWYGLLFTSEGRLGLCVFVVLVIIIVLYFLGVKPYCVVE